LIGEDNGKQDVLPNQEGAGSSAREAGRVIRFEPNLLHLFTEAPFMARFERAAAAGFSAVEFPTPYEEDAAVLADALERHRLQLVLINSPGGDLATQRGLACQPALRPEFRDSIDVAIRYAATLGGPLLHCPAGMTPEGEDPQRLRDTYIDNLRFAARRCAAEGLSMAIEPISAAARPGYFLNCTTQALGIIADLDEPNVGLILDTYHVAMTGEDILELLPATASVLSHVQIADAPGKGEPGSGSIDFHRVFALLDEMEYGGWIGLEYSPAAGTEAGLKWMDAYASPSEPKPEERAPP
jgi:hydroxypyruvate isomerase